MLKQVADNSLAKDRIAKSVWDYLRGARPLVLLTSPLIYLGVLPFALLDLFVTVYQAVCFPTNGIPKVQRSDYLIFDRGRLPYLNAIEKVGCIYCSYANGLLAYVAEIAARTEQHFCPIKHAAALPAPHSRYPRFLPFGDARAYRTVLDDVRGDFADIRPEPAHVKPEPKHSVG